MEDIENEIFSLKLNLFNIKKNIIVSKNEIELLYNTTLIDEKTILLLEDKLNYLERIKYRWLRDNADFRTKLYKKDNVNSSTGSKVENDDWIENCNAVEINLNKDLTFYNSAMANESVEFYKNEILQMGSNIKNDNGMVNEVNFDICGISMYKKKHNDNVFENNKDVNTDQLVSSRLDDMQTVNKNSIGLYLGRMDPSCKTNDIRDILDEILEGFNFKYILHKLKSKITNYNSYFVGCCKEAQNIIVNFGDWKEDAIIRPFVGKFYDGMIERENRFFNYNSRTFKGKKYNSGAISIENSAKVQQSNIKDCINHNNNGVVISSDVINLNSVEILSKKSQSFCEGDLGRVDNFFSRESEGSDVSLLMNKVIGKSDILSVADGDTLISFNVLNNMNDNLDMDINVQTNEDYKAIQLSSDNVLDNSWNTNLAKVQMNEKCKELHQEELEDDTLVNAMITCKLECIDKDILHKVDAEGYICGGESVGKEYGVGSYDTDQDPIMGGDNL